MIYNKKINRLIEVALTDGEITDKEREVLLRLAEEEGIDLDEFEMVLDARIYEKFHKPSISTPKQTDSKAKSSASPPSPPPRQQANRNKCLACGADREAFTTKCSDCGTVFRDAESFTDVVSFNRKLSSIDEYWGNFTEKKGCFVMLGRGLLWVLFWPVLIYIHAWKVVNYYSKPSLWSMADIKKEELIISYPVPITQNAILEFMTFCASKIQMLYYPTMFSKESKYKHAWNKVWIKKINQLAMKASLSMEDDTRALQKVETIVEQAQSIHGSNGMKIFTTSIFVLGMVVWSVFGMVKCQRNLIKTEQRNISIVNLAERRIENKDYNGALQLLDSTTGEYQLEIRCKVQLSKLTERLDEIERALPSKEYEKLSREFTKLKWFWYSPDNNSDYLKIEKRYFEAFQHKKTLLNDQFPEEFRMIEKE